MRKNLAGHFRPARVNSMRQKKTGNEIFKKIKGKVKNGGMFEITCVHEKRMQVVFIYLWQMALLLQFKSAEVKALTKEK